MKEKIVLVTGSTDGIGAETALELARKGVRVILHGRDADRGARVTEKIRSAAANAQLDYLCYDFASLRSVEAMAKAVRENYGRLDGLINNAGVYMKKRVLSKDGFETTFAVNHLAHFLLTFLLLDLLKQSAPSRIITVSSVAHQSAQLDFENLQGEIRYDGYRAYSLSKLANVLFTYALARRLEGEKVTANALHPGVIDTKLLHEGFGPGGAPVEEGAKTPVYLALSAEAGEISGRYFDDKRPVRSSRISYDTGLQEKLWKASEDLCAKALAGKMPAAKGLEL